MINEIVKYITILYVSLPNHHILYLNHWPAFEVLTRRILQKKISANDKAFQKGKFTTRMRQKILVVKFIIATKILPSFLCCIHSTI